MEKPLVGLSAAPGEAVGKVRMLVSPSTVDRRRIPHSMRRGEMEVARHALDQAGAEIETVAVELRESGRDEEAEIVETGALIAQDPALLREVLALVIEAGMPAAAAIRDVCEAQAQAIASIEDTRLAERADDVRSVGRRAARLIGSQPGRPQAAASNGPREILVAEDLGPADVAELDTSVVGIALAAGGISAHAAIVARSLGIPMVVGVGSTLLGAAPCSDVVVDGNIGTVFLAPAARRVTAAGAELDRLAARRARTRANRDLPSITGDGHRVQVLANVSGSAELASALEAGAEGVGLLRTELAFLTAPDWPSEDDHRRHLEPILLQLRDRVATVRVLDFGADKTPPFLAGVGQRGIELLLDHPARFAAQLRAIVASAADTQLRLLLPMVDSVDQVLAARELVAGAVRAVPGGRSPRVGAMIETSAGVEAVRTIAAEADFLSIGTNDLTHSILRADRFAPQAARTHNPRVLRAIAVVSKAAAEAGVPLEVCGEAASDPIAAPLLIGAGIDELSVGAARVGTVRHWVRMLDFEQVSALEVAARRLETATQVEKLTAEISDRLSLLERADTGTEVVEGPIGVDTVSTESQRRSASRA